MDIKLSSGQRTTLELLAEGGQLRRRRDVGLVIVTPGWITSPPARDGEIEELIELGLISNGRLTDEGRKVISK